LGDTVLLLPFITYIYKKYKAPKIFILTKENYKDVFSANPYIYKVITISNSENLLSSIRNIIRLRKTRFDIVIDAHRVLRSILYYFFLKANKKLHIKKFPIRRFLYTTFLRRFFSLDLPQKALQYLITIYGKDEEKNFSILDGKIYWDKKTVFDTKKKIFFVDKNKGVKLVGLAVGSRWELKKWKYFTKLIDLLLSDREDYFIYLIGDENDGKKFTYNESKRIIPVFGKLNLKELAFLISNMDFVVCNDSAILHIAESVGVPVVAIFGPTSSEFGFFPRKENSILIELKLPCKPCTKTGKGKCKKRKQYCLELISHILVYKTIKERFLQ